ncbi:MAG: RdgB/HAM1 family non-canonical purine NTP pyrophosphatase [Patescibacteria group bacterium]
MKLLFATQNKGKQEEIRDLLGKSVELLFPSDLALSDLEVEESGNTFKENAFLKAKTFADEFAVITAADDSGLSVEMLDGMPGVYSDRFFSGNASDKNLALLEKLGNNKNRQAKFTTAICLYNPISKEAKYFLGKINGLIALRVKGERGFGYDPIFIPEGSNKTWGELGPEEKSKNSHRAKALNKLKQYLRNKL